MVVLFSFFIRSGGFPLGIAIACFLLLLNVCAIMLFKTLDDQGINNDPGIVIWWLCCIRVGKKVGLRTLLADRGLSIRPISNFGPNAVRKNSNMSMSITKKRGYYITEKNSQPNNLILKHRVSVRGKDDEIEEIFEEQVNTD